MTGRPAVVAVIPARYASTRLPGKPLIDLCGKPMIRHVCERAAAAAGIDRVIVATDHEAIAGAVRSFGGEVMMTSPDCRSGSDRVAEVARALPGADILVNLQGDEPLIEPAAITLAVSPLLPDDSVKVATLVRAISDEEDLRNPAVVKVVVGGDGNALYFSRAPVPFVRDGGTPVRYKHIGLYVFRRETLMAFSRWPRTPLEQAENLEQLRLLEHGVAIRTSVTEYDAIAVDTPADADRVRRLLENQQ